MGRAGEEAMAWYGLLNAGTSMTTPHWQLLAGVPPAQVRAFLALARQRRFRSGQIVFHRADPADSMHLIVRGRFAVHVMTAAGKTVTIGMRGPGESFGELALFSGDGLRAATVEALEDGETLAVPAADFHRLRDDHPVVNDALLAFLAGEIRRQNDLLLDALYAPAEQRVLRRLGELAGLYGQNGQALVPLGQEALAGLAGTSRATVNRVLRAEQSRGTIELRRRAVCVLDVGALTASAQRKEEVR
jgi:CRP-like cAMP-binding protein